MLPLVRNQCSLQHLVDHLLAGVYAMNYFSSDKLSGLKTREDGRCKCGAQPKLAYQMMDSTRGLTVRMFRCACGERRWTEDKE
jgi:hypothetical protein